MKTIQPRHGASPSVTRPMEIIIMRRARALGFPARHADVVRGQWRVTDEHRCVWHTLMRLQDLFNQSAASPVYMVRPASSQASGALFTQEHSYE